MCYKVLQYSNLNDIIVYIRKINKGKLQIQSKFTNILKISNATLLIISQTISLKLH